MKQLIKLALMFSAIIFIITGCLNEGLTLDDIGGDRIIKSLSTDKSRYEPADEVIFNLILESAEDETGDISLLIKHLGETVGKVEDSVDLTAGVAQQISIFFKAPEEDFRGYNAEVWYQSKNSVDMIATAIDVSSDWKKFPRYGYLVEFQETSTEELESVIDGLNDYHINGLQFYDWQYKHQQPLAGTVESPDESWVEIAKRPVEKKTVDDYIGLSHEKNMMAMNYNLMFGVYEDYLNDGVKDEWGLYKMPKGKGLDYHPLPSTWATTKLYLMDPSNEAWQQYLISAEKDAFDVYDFDGWHVDQLGDRGTRYNINGERVNLPEAYVRFLEIADRTLDTRFVFNAVSEFAQLSLAGTHVDFLYAELWNSHSRYVDLKGAIDRGVAFSDGEKNVVLAAYMNYGLADFPGTFNTPGVLLTDAVIFAAGGAHIELGDTGMLGKEYFPNKNLKMDDNLKTSLLEYYDFAVAYQNLLRDGAVKISRKVVSDDYKMTTRGSKDQIWYFAKEKENLELLHLINLIGNDEQWRDNTGTKKEPETIEKLTIKYYTDSVIKRVTLATPDFDQGIDQEVVFKSTTDDFGNYIEIVIPRLKYWDMILLEK